MAKILVIEADLFLSKFYAVKLKQLKHEVDVCLNGQDALQKLKVHAYDAALLELILPYRDGFELLKDMRRLRKKLHIKIITTELQQKEDIKRAFEFGASLYFIKNQSQTYEIINCLQALLKGKPLPAEHGVTMRLPAKKSGKKKAPKTKKVTKQQKATKKVTKKRMKKK